MAKITYGNRNQFRTNICSDEDLRHNARLQADLYDLLGAPAEGAEYSPKDIQSSPGEGHPDYPDHYPTRDDPVDVEPARAWTRFKLTGTFNASPRGGTAAVADCKI